MLLAQNINTFTIVMFAIAGCAFVAILLFLLFDKLKQSKLEKSQKKTTEKLAKQEANQNQKNPAKEQTIVCPNCGKELSADNKFCSNCGSKLD